MYNIVLIILVILILIILLFFWNKECFKYKSFAEGGKGWYPWGPYAHIPPAGTSGSSLNHLIELEQIYPEEKQTPYGGQVSSRNLTQ